MRLAPLSLGSARDKLAEALGTIREVEIDLYRRSSKEPELAQTCQELVEASEGIDRSIESLDEIMMGVT